MTKLTCFKAYDIRGKLGEELNEDIAFRIVEPLPSKLSLIQLLSAEMYA